MKNLLGLGVFGTFGKPFGFQQYFYFNTSFDQSLDLNTNAIEVFPDTELYSVRKEISNGSFSICISIYTYAKEVNSGRGGTFIGSSILLNDSYLEAENIYSLLKELHLDVINNEKNIVNNTLQVQQATQLIVKEPTNFERINSSIKNIREAGYFSDSISTSKKFLITAEPNSQLSEEKQVISFISDSIEYFTDVDTMFFTFDNNVVQYVNQKGLLKIVRWESFLNQKELIRKEQREKNKTEEAVRVPVVQKKKPENPKRPKSHNNSNVGTVPAAPKFEEWKFNGTWDQKEEKKKIAEHNSLLDYCIQLEKQTSGIPVPVENSESSVVNPGIKKSKRSRINYKFLLSFIGNVLLVLAICIYLLFFNEPRVEYKQIEPREQVFVTNPYSVELLPAPNNELNAASRMLIAKAGLKNKPDKAIAKVIFSKNPVEIDSVYSKQKEIYTRVLISLNKECFEKKDSAFICICDSLARIPSFKR